MEKAVRLNSGTRMPLVGLGTASSTPASLELMKNAIIEAIKVGYRHIDTASVYGSEPAVGEAIADAIKSGVVKREELFVTSKVWCAQLDDVVGALKGSLRALQLEYLDLYLIHWPLSWSKECWRTPTLEDVHHLHMDKTWKQMEKCVHIGLAKSIGVSNFSSKKINELLKVANIPPSVNQVEMHPKWQQKRLRETCAKANIIVTAWSPLGNPGVKWGSNDVIDHPIIKEIAEKHNRTPAQVALRWGLEQGVSVIVKSFNRTRMKENLDIFNWYLTKEDHEKIAKFEQKKRKNAPTILLSDGSFYDDPRLWDGDI